MNENVLRQQKCF